jgi:16S rRNA (guanine966-N2)-methyltransferase
MGLLAPTLKSIIATDWLSKDGVIIAELASDDKTDFPGSLDIVDERTQGQQRIVFLMQN